MADETYNGWTNKPTWLVKLWIDNDQGEQEYWLDTARDFANNFDSAESHLAEILQETFTEAADGYELDTSITKRALIGHASVFSDLMSYVLACVDWYEVAHALIEDSSEVLA